MADRDLSLIARSLVQTEHYSALAKSFQVYDRPVESLGRYFLGRGDWPADIRVGTPSGAQTVRAYSVHDMFTVHELFCRHDYAIAPDAGTVVDIGSNIGISARYFLAWAPGVQLHLYEPVPLNVLRLREQLAGFEDAFTISDKAVSDRAGAVAFGVEPSGRYGGIGLETDEMIEVECLDINDVLEEVLDTTDEIDLLKIDTEGAELATLDAIRPELLRRVRSICLETYENPNPLPDVFKGSRQVMVRRLDRS